jgi:hypothetical protein
MNYLPKNQLKPKRWTQLKGSWQIIDDNYIEYEAR